MLPQTPTSCEKKSLIQETLSENQIQVWQIPLSSDLPKRQEVLKKILSEKELKKALRLHSPTAQTRAIASRVAMRLLLATHLHCDPRSLQFCYTQNGKPYLKNSTITFNLSHSGQLALLAISRHTPLGVDLEKINPHRAIQQLVARYFSSEESKWIASQTSSIVAFHQLWVYKEALAKALASSIYEELSTEIIPQAPPPFPIKNYFLHPLPISDDYVAALASPASDCKITFHSFGEKQWEC